MRNQSRTGFTLIELMVVMALTLFIMVILSQAFITSLDTFTNMKGIGDMQINLRTAEMLLRDDLSMDHFEGKRRLSDAIPGLLAPTSAIVAQPPQAGFFTIRRATGLGSPSYVNEGNDAFNVPSYRAVDHFLYMTVKRKGNRPENFYTTSITGDAPSVVTPFFNQKTAYNIDPLNQLPYVTWTMRYNAPGGGTATGYYSSQWAEVLYYLIRTGSTETPNDPTSIIGTPTFALYRAQWVMLPDPTTVSTMFPNTMVFGIQSLPDSTFAGLSCNNFGAPGTAKTKFFSPADAATDSIVAFNAAKAGMGPTRMIPDILGFNPASFDPRSNIRASVVSTLVCPNVLSFQIQVMELPQPGVSPTFDDMNGVAGNPKGYLYDTTRFNGASQAAGYTQNGLKAVQVTLRLWETKTRQTRQATFVVDM